MITDKDVEKIEKKLEKKIVTKEDLKKYATKNDLVQFKDDILSEIVKIRDDISVIIGYRDMIEDHETRISKFETEQSLTS